MTSAPRSPRARSFRSAAVLAAVMSALVGCGDGGRAAAPSTTVEPSGSGATTSVLDDPAAAVSTRPSPGCDAGATPPVSLERRDLPVAELTRWYLITVPAAGPPDAGAEVGAATPMPLVLDFHGLTEGAELHAQMSGMGAFAESHGFVAVIPHGNGDLARWAAGPGGEAGGPNADVDFVIALLDRVGDEVCIDLSRVYATGLSNGAMLTSMLACRLADRFAAVAPIAGVTDFNGCEPSSPVPMLTIHGTADPILLFNGGVGDLVKLISGGLGDAGGPGDGSGVTTPPTIPLPVDLDGPGYPANVAAWAERNGCEPTPTDAPVSDTVTRRTYDCPAGADVEMYIVAGGGHAWPGSEFSKGIERIVGPTTFDIDATELLWEFFQRFRRA